MRPSRPDTPRSRYTNTKTRLRDCTTLSIKRPAFPLVRIISHLVPPRVLTTHLLPTYSPSSQGFPLLLPDLHPLEASFNFILLPCDLGRTPPNSKVLLAVLICTVTRRGVGRTVAIPPKTSLHATSGASTARVAKAPPTGTLSAHARATTRSRA